jgi:hypothetical protein
MATLNWPAGRAFGARHYSFGVSTPKSAFAGFFTGQSQSISHLADRLRCTVLMPKCEPVDAARREAFFMEVGSAGHWVRMGHLQRTEPAGTLRGTPTLVANALAGARSISIQSVVNATLLGGDPLGAGGQLLFVGHAGAVADGIGVLVVPLVLPLRAALVEGAAVAWAAPTTTFQLVTDLALFRYGRARWAEELELEFAEVY